MACSEDNSDRGVVGTWKCEYFTYDVHNDQHEAQTPIQVFTFSKNGLLRFGEMDSKRTITYNKRLTWWTDSDDTILCLYEENHGAGKPFSCCDYNAQKQELVVAQLMPPSSGYKIMFLHCKRMVNLKPIKQ